MLTDRECQANHFANYVGLRNRSIDFNEENQEFLLNEILKIDPDLVVTTVNKILRKPIVDKLGDRLINLHYSILSAFGGLIGASAVKAAIDYGAKFTGVTVHFVDESLDAGKPIVQGVIPLHIEEDNFDSLMNLVFRCGCLALLASINLRLNGEGLDSTRSIVMMKRTCLFSGASVNPFPGLTSENFWQEVARKAEAV